MPRKYTKRNKIAPVESYDATEELVNEAPIELPMHSIEELDNMDVNNMTKAELIYYTNVLKMRTQNLDSMIKSAFEQTRNAMAKVERITNMVNGQIDFLQNATATHYGTVLLALKDLKGDVKNGN